MASNVCWGIEVGSGAVKAVKLERTATGVNVVDFALIPHKRVLSTPEIDEKEAKRVAMGTLISQHELKGASIAISVPGHSAFARFAKLPPVEPKKIPDIVKFEAVQQIPFPIDDVEWDYQTFASPDSPDVEVGIFAMTRERVTDTLTKWQDLGHTPDALTLSPLAAYNAISYDQAFSEQTPGTVILDVGTTSTDLIVAEGGRLWIRTFPIGGHQFTEALVTHFNLTYTKAEKLKREAENTEHARHVLQAMRPVFGDLAQDVQRSIGYYQSTHKNAKLTRLIGLGGTFNLPGLRKFLSQQLQIEVVKLEAWDRVKMEGAKNAEFQANAALFATAIGCALQGLGNETISANLMPVTVVREAMWNRKTPWFVAAAAVGILAGGASFVGPMLDRTALLSKPKPAEIDAAKREAKALKDKWKSVEAEYKADARAISTMDMLQDRDLYGYLLDDLGTMMKTAKGLAPDERPSDNRVQFVRWSTNYQMTPLSEEELFQREQSRAPTRPGQPVAAAPEGTDNRPRVKVTLQIACTKPDAQADRLVNDAFIAWLRANANRPNVPYIIEMDGKRALRVLSREKVADAPKPTFSQPPPGEPTEEIPGEFQPERPSQRPGGPGQVNPRDPRRPGAARPATPPPSFSNAPKDKPGAEEVNKIAPVPILEPIGSPGTFVSYYQIEFDAIIKPPATDAKEAGQ